MACSAEKGGTAVRAAPAPVATAAVVREKPEEKEATDEDPREHLNIVFIGHGERTLGIGTLFV